MFGLEPIRKYPDHGSLLRWNQQEVAVDCWFTSAGRMMPLRMKCREAERILTVEPITVIKEEESRFAGILVHIFYCKASLNGQSEKEFQLLFYVEQCKWRAAVGDRDSA